MNFQTLLVLYLLNLSLEETIAVTTEKVVCYYKSWTRQDVFSVDDIDVDICTHVNFAFMRLNDDGSFRFDEAGGDESVLQKFGALKSKNPAIKLLITVGGWFEDAVTFSRVAADDHKKSTLATSLLRYMNTYNIDGIDIDWLYPTKNGGSSDDKKNLIDLVTVIRSALNDTGGGVITVAIPAYPDPDAYDVNTLSKLVDGLNVLTYDFHGFATDTKTGENSPLYPAANDTDGDKSRSNCDAAINNWLNAGADPTKLILGMAFYGHIFNLVDPEQHGVGAPADGGDEDYTAYHKLCSWSDGWIEDWDDEGKVPFKYSKTEKQWISYDNAKSIGLKVEYAKSRNLGGVMMWSVNDDDYAAECGNKNVLLKAIKDNL